VPDYRRDLTPGGTYFFTVALRDRSARTLVQHIDTLRAAIRVARRQSPFEIIAWVVLPEHMHSVWKLPEGDSDYAGRWRIIKTQFTRKLAPSRSRRPSQARRGEKGIWQRRFWEHRIRDDRDLQVHVDYIHFNPVKHGYCTRACDWPYSTFHRWVRSGHYDVDWGVSETSFSGGFGE